MFIKSDRNLEVPQRVQLDHGKNFQKQIVKKKICNFGGVKLLVLVLVLLVVVEVAFLVLFVFFGYLYI